jgi:bifunctional non-homologous end joining protein LigD
VSAPAVTHPDRVLFPEDGITKGEVVEYYEAVAPVMVRHLRERPLMLERVPQGIGAGGFFRKDLEDPPASVRTVAVPKKGGTVCHGVADRPAALRALANFGTLTFHPWLSRADRLDCPDQLIFDLDPSADDFGVACTAALALRGVLEELGLVPFVKTTGKRGLHVVTPLDRKADFDAARGFARDVADLAAARHPERLTTAVRKAKRDGRLFVDTLRNGYAQTAVAPYSLRATSGAPVATPLEWDELTGADCHPTRYTLVELPKRVDEISDPWASMTRRARSLSAPRRRVAEVRAEMSTGRS